MCIVNHDLRVLFRPIITVDVLKYEEIDTPKPPPGHILINVLAEEIWMPSSAGYAVRTHRRSYPLSAIVSAAKSLHWRN